MGQLIPEDTLTRVRQSTDIVDLIGYYVPLRRSGKSFKGLCPFHDEKTPSFHVNVERQTYHCFGCGTSGDVFSFLMAQEKLGFLDAVRELADRAGISIDRPDPRAAAEESRRAELMRAIEWATRFFETTLRTPEGASARQYLKSRSISPEIATSFRLGFAPNRWDGLLSKARQAGLSTEVLRDAGLVAAGREPGAWYDRFRGRLTFPIFDLRGRPVAFGARTLDGSEPKYLNSPETSLFSKGRILYGLHAARESAQRERRIAIVEGYTDVLLAHQCGYASVAATLGTALTRDHARLVRRFAEDVRLVYDADEGGERAAERGIEIFLEEGLEVRVAALPNGLDPCDLLVRDGLEAFRAAVDSARDYVEHAIETTARRHDLATVSGRAAAAEALLGLVRKLSDPIRRDLVIRRIANETHVSEAALRDRLAADRKKAAPSKARERGATATATPPRRRAEEDLVAWILARPERVPDVAGSLSTEGVESDLASILEAAFSLARRGEVPTSDRLLLAVESDEARLLVSALLAREGADGLEDRRFDDAVLALKRREQRARLSRMRHTGLEALKKGDSEAIDDWLRATQRELRES